MILDTCFSLKRIGFVRRLRQKEFSDQIKTSKVKRLVTQKAWPLDKTLGMKSLLFLVVCSVLFISPASAQWMLINQVGGVPDSSAALEIQDTTRGFLAPRLTTVQMNAISSPAMGLLIYKVAILLINTLMALAGKV